MSTATVSRKLQAEGLPVTLNRGAGYHYFVFDNGTDFETESVMVFRYSDLPQTKWLALGREYAARVQAEIDARPPADASPFKFKIGKAR